MVSRIRTNSVERLLAIGGAVGTVLQSQAIQHCPLGCPETWPPSLKTALGICFSSPFPSAILWGDRSLLIANPAFHQAWRKPITPQTVSQPLQAVAPKLWQQLEAALQHVQQTGERLELQAPHCFQQWGYSGSLSPIFDDTDGLPGVLLILTRHSEQSFAEAALRESEEHLKQANERFQLAATAINALIYDWSIFTHRVERTDGLTRVLGYSLEEAEPTMEWWLERMHPDDVPGAQQRFLEAIAQGDRFNNEYRVLNKDNQYVYVLDCGLVVSRDEAGNPTRIVGSTTDISVAKQAEQERNRLLQREQAAREEAERTNRIKDEFLAVLSHELRSPLNPILGWASLLQKRELERPILKQALETIERNSKLQLRLIDDLLDVSRILRGKLKLEREVVHLPTVVMAAMETVHLSAEAKEIRIVSRFDATIKPVLGDEGRLQQVVWNLLSNAVKFTPTGGHVEITLEQCGNYTQIQVRDTGKGIRADFLPHVFEHFQQEDGSITRKFGGLGLGLAIVRYICEMHGGSISVESPGENLGTTFTIHLPSLLNQPTLEVCGDTTHSPQVYPQSFQGLQILVVEDEEDNRNFIQFALEEVGVLVTAVASAKEAIAHFQQAPPEILISDIAMPEMDGYTLIQYVRSHAPEKGGRIPAIALTAYAGEGDAQKALRAGFDYHLSKPVNPHLLYQTLLNFLQNTNQAK